jgi:hypothetical protein
MNFLPITEQQAKQLVHAEGLSRLQRILILLAVGSGAKSVSALKEIAVRCGLRAASRWNVSDVLRKSNACAVLTVDGWELAEKGERTVQELAGAKLQRVAVKKTVADVRQHVSKISSGDARDFIEEAISCFESGQFRAAVVFSWVGAVSLMHNHVVQNALSAFNTEARRRDSKWKDARNSDELGRMKEHDFLDVLEAIGSVGKNVKQTLQNQCLSLRNACGHPNSLKISENGVAAHLDILVLNVYSRF